MAPSIAPPYLHGDRLRDWQQLWDVHPCCAPHPPEESAHDSLLDAPELLPHHCAIRNLLLNDDVLLRWVRLRAEWPTQEGLVVG